MIYRFGPHQLDTARFELRTENTPVAIEPKVLQLMIHLVEQRHRLVSRDDLIGAVWQGRAVSDWTVSGAVKAARRAIGDSGARQDWIRTVHGQGFRFSGAVTETETPTPGMPTLLILPLRSLSGDGPDYFADGLTEDLISDLAAVPGLRVLSRNDAFAFRDRQTTPEAFARHLGATHILSGSLRSANHKVRINVELTQAGQAAPIWAERLDGDLSDVFGLQDAINARLAASLKLHIARQAGHHARPPSCDPQAYDLCLRARSEYYLYTPEHMACARDLFEQAIARDPEYAEAYAYLSYCRCTAHVFAWPGSDDTLDSAETLARKAVDLDPTSAVAHARLGWILGFCNRLSETIAAFDRAVTLGPRSAEILQSYGETMNRAADPQKALPLIEKAFGIDTFVPPSWDFARGHSEVLMGKTKAAIARFVEVLDRVPRFVPARVQLARAYAEDGAPDKAAETVAALRRTAPRYALSTALRMFPYPPAAERDRLTSALIAAGLPEKPSQD